MQRYGVTDWVDVDVTLEVVDVVEGDERGSGGEGDSGLHRTLRQKE
jgi:hypothetical protein